jgi:MFS family permease
VIAITTTLATLRRHFTLPAGDLLRDAVYRRLWTSILISTFGGQVTLLALPLTAAVLLQATPWQMGLLGAIEMAPFVLFSLPSGVWLDRVRKLPVYIVGECVLALALLGVPLAWWLGVLSMGGLYAIGFVLGTVATVSGSAAQIVLTQIVPRQRLIEAHAKNALASSGAEVAGPGFAGVLIKLVGAPLALLADALMLLFSALILRGIHVDERRTKPTETHFWRELKAGLRFVTGQRLLVSLAVLAGGWQFCNQSAMVVQILFATRRLGLSEQAVGLCYVAMGVGTVLASIFGHRFSRRVGPGPSLLWGFAVCACGWLLLSWLPANAWGVAGFALMLSLSGMGAVLIFINYLALRQAVTPEPMLGRMTATMRWLSVFPAGPGALWGGYVGQHLGLRAALVSAGLTALALVVYGVLRPEIRRLMVLPSLHESAPAQQPPVAIPGQTPPTAVASRD